MNTICPRVCPKRYTVANVKYALSLGQIRCADPHRASVPVCAGSTRQHGVERAWRGHREGREGQAGAEERRVGAPDGAGYVPISALYLPPYRNVESAYLTLVGRMNMRSHVAEGASFWQTPVHPTLRHTPIAPSCMAMRGATGLPMSSTHSRNVTFGAPIRTGGVCRHRRRWGGARLHSHSERGTGRPDEGLGEDGAANVTFVAQRT